MQYLFYTIFFKIAFYRYPLKHTLTFINKKNIILKELKKLGMCYEEKDNYSLASNIDSLANGVGSALLFK